LGLGTYSYKKKKRPQKERSKGVPESYLSKGNATLLLLPRRRVPKKSGSWENKTLPWTVQTLNMTVGNSRAGSTRGGVELAN